MLVLSRPPGQKVVFPSLGITIDVLRLRGTVVRLGIDVQEDIPILGNEVINRDAPGDDSVPVAERSVQERERRHAWRNKLNEGMLRLQLLQRQLEIGKVVDLEQCLQDVIGELSDLEQATTDTVLKAISSKVLIVEDQPNERELLATCLRLGGFEVATACNGDEAFDSLHGKELPDLVLLNLRTPDGDGPTFLQSLRNDVRLHALRVFAVTGSSRSEFDSEPLPLDGWISKPVRIDSLIRAISKDQESKTARA